MRRAGRAAGVVLAVCVTPGGARADSPGAVPDIAGHWRSEAAEPLSPGADGDVDYLSREFRISRDRWHIRFTIFDDAAMTQPLFHGESSGTYRLTATASGMALAEFLFEERSLTPHSDDVREALTASGCGDEPWEPGVVQSVYERGCAAFRIRPRATCDREYDLARRDGARLFLGARPKDGNLCTPDRRPATLGAALVREPG